MSALGWGRAASRLLGPDALGPDALGPPDSTSAARPVPGA